MLFVVSEASLAAGGPADLRVEAQGTQWIAGLTVRGARARGVNWHPGGLSGWTLSLVLLQLLQVLLLLWHSGVDVVLQSNQPGGGVVCGVYSISVFNCRRVAVAEWSFLLQESGALLTVNL